MILQCREAIPGGGREFAGFGADLIKEVFGDQIPEILEDEEAMSTISKFFENNLNISETARQLYVHRNTLVYRLERIENAIGLDIRKFDDAMTFRIAIMVLAHVKDIKKQ